MKFAVVFRCWWLVTYIMTEVLFKGFVFHR